LGDSYDEDYIKRDKNVKRNDGPSYGATTAEVTSLETNDVDHS